MEFPLPVEVITQILGFLNKQSDLFHASLVSRAWYAASRDPCLRSAVNVTVHMSPSMRLLTEVIYLNQSEVIRLKVVVVPEDSHHRGEGSVGPSSQRASESCFAQSCFYTSSADKSSLFGMPFTTLVIRCNPWIGNAFNICDELIKKCRNLWSLELTAGLIDRFTKIDCDRLNSALCNITDLHLDSPTWNLDVQSLPLLKTLTVETASLEDLGVVLALCEESAGRLKVCIHDSGTRIVIPTPFSEDLPGFKCVQCLKICRMGFIDLLLTEERLEWLGTMSHNIRKLDLHLQSQPDVNMMKRLHSELKSIEHILIDFPCADSEVRDILASSVSSDVGSIVVEGPCFSLSLLGRNGRSPRGMHMNLRVHQETIEPASIVFAIHRSPWGLFTDPGVNFCRSQGTPEVEFEIFEFEVAPRYVQFIKHDDGEVSSVAHLEVDAALGFSMDRLQQLNVSGTLLSDEGLRSLAIDAFDLRCLNVSNCSDVTDGGIRAIVTTCKKLQRLNVADCRSLTHKCVKYIARWSSLRLLGVITSDKYHSKAVELLVPRGVRLGWGNNEL